MSKRIPLSQGLFATVDDADFDWLNQWKWSALKTGKMRTTFYAVRMQQKGEYESKRKMILMHRVIIGAPKGMVVDHRDGNGLNNRRRNIRVCTLAESSLNSPGHADAVGSRFKGVAKRGNKFAAHFRGKYIGRFRTQEEAAVAYDRVAYAHNPEFALTNRELVEA